MILDMVMPAIEGKEVFRRLQEMKPGVKVLVSSGYSHDQDAVDLLEQGARSFLQKPFRIAELVRVVGEVMEEKQEAHGAIAEDPGRSKRV